MEKIKVRTYLHVSYICPKCVDHESYSTLATKKPETVECTKCRTIFKAV